jgi:tripeptidyl-peptidase-1
MHFEQPSAFNDVSEGSNRCNRAYCCEYGFQAQHGWDPVVGLGSPDFKNMFAYVKQQKGL